MTPRPTAHDDHPDKRGDVLATIAECFDDAFSHDGYADITVHLRIRRKGEKEVIVHYGKEYRFVLPCPTSAQKLSPPTAMIRRSTRS